MNAAAPVIRSGNVWLPHPALFPWVSEFLNEAEAAPRGCYMDQVDSASQYLNHRYVPGMDTTRALAVW
jgi:phage terminase large subunit-like protein